MATDRCPECGGFPADEFGAGAFAPRACRCRFTSEADRFDGETERLSYLTTGELREEIAYAVGADPTRYGAGSDRGLRKADVARIAAQLQPADSDLEIRDCTLGTLYEAVCEWAGGEYQPNASKPWGINRDNLKTIHRAVGASDPRRTPVVSDDVEVIDSE